jgi:O-antigen/teichoic acid export membrane protein
MAAPPLAASASLAAYLFFVRHPGLRPRLRDWSLSSFRSLMSFGIPLQIVGLGDLGILYSMNIVISNRLGPGSVPGFAVPASAFMVFSSLAYGLVYPYLPAYAEAQARGDWHWIRQTAFRRLAIAVGLVLAAGLGMTVLGRTAVRVWTGGRVVPEQRFLLAMAVYFVLTASATANGILLMGLGRVKTKAAIHLSVAGVFVAGSWLLLPRLGLVAVPLAGCAAYLIDCATSLPLALRHIRRRAALAL